MNNKIIIFTNIISILILTGCSSPEFRPSEMTSDIQNKSLPSSEIRVTRTNFSDSLICMDRLFGHYNVKNNVIGLENILDKTGAVKADRKEFLISAISQMSARSNAFIVSAFDVDLLNTLKINQFGSQLGAQQNITLPDFFISGAYFIDKSILNEKRDIGTSLNIAPFFGGMGQSKDRTASIVSMDLNMGDISTLTMLPGLTSSNSIAVVRHGKASNFDAGIEKFGVNLELSFNKNEGMNQAIRSLVQLSLIELLGKASKVPYWECLDIESTNPEINNELEEWYLSMNHIEKIKYIQKELMNLGFFNDKINGIETQQLKLAIIKFKREHHLTADSKISFELYKKLMLKPQQKTNENKIKQTHLIPLDFAIETDKKWYHAGDNIKLSLSLTNDAYVHCFYEDTDKKVFKIFPNKFVSKSYLKAGNGLTIPGENMRFKLNVSKRNVQEHILCLVSYQNLDQSFIQEPELHNELILKNLTAISVDKLSDLVNVYTQYATIKPLFKTININIQ